MLFASRKQASLLEIVYLEHMALLKEYKYSEILITTLPAWTSWVPVIETNILSM